MTALPAQPLSPLDGRYREQTTALGEYLSEAGLNRARLHVEVEWLLYVTENGLFGSAPLSDTERDQLRQLVTEFSAETVADLARIEARTRHDVKAVELYIRAALPGFGLDRIAELVHICCTSEDINNLAYALTIQDAVTRVWLPQAQHLCATIAELAESTRTIPMLAHTHGQPATPTTVGKELAVTVHRLQRQLGRVEKAEYLGKFNGATGTYAAHVAADPDADWPTHSRSFVEGLGLSWNPLTTQIESHDWQADLYADVMHAGRILHNFCTDMWTYISLDYFHQQAVAGEVGSSTMPHKVNPIRFENAEANLEISAALFSVLAETLVTSRMQRDLTDSTTQRNIGLAFGHSLLAINNIERGLAVVAVNADRLAADLDANWEVLAEAIQTVIRAEAAAGRSQITDPYSLLKELTRGHRIGHDDVAAFISTLDVGEEAKARLLSLTPATYIGLASTLVDYLDGDPDND